MDKDSGVFSDLDKIHPLNHKGKFCSVQGPLNIARPVQWHTESGKQTYTNPKTGVQVVEDLSGRYFRICDPSLPGKRKYLDLDGSVPNNKLLETGSQVGRTQSEYNEVTHFNIYGGE
ncbi:hypothetical protein AAFN90_08895 [Erwiniaceae bacterium CAU 1747]